MKRFITIITAAFAISAFGYLPPKDIDIQINYSEKNIKINSLALSGSTTIASIQEVLGTYDRIKVEEGFSNYFFDEAGIMVIVNEEKTQLHGIMIQLYNNNGEFSTEEDFKGKLTVNEKKINPLKGMGAMERLISDINPRNTRDYKLTGAIDAFKVDYLYKPGGRLLMIYVNFAE